MPAHLGSVLELSILENLNPIMGLELQSRSGCSHDIANDGCCLTVVLTGHVISFT